MNNRSSIYVKRIVQTAIFLALLIVCQFFTAPLGQYVTGSTVNFILIACTLTIGLYCGLAIALISPIIAFMVGIGPALPQIIPFIMLGNCVLVITWFLICKYCKLSKSEYPAYLIAAVCAALLKFLTFYLGLIKVALPIFLNRGIIKAPQLNVLSAAFSFPQLITALIGGAIAIILIPQLKKIIK